MPATALDIDTIREDFPALHQQVRGERLAYLDNAATTQKPWPVLRAIQSYYQHDNANVHRGVHSLSQRATLQFDEARSKIARFINAESEAQLIFTKGCTEAINLVAATWGSANLKPGDEILLSNMEHHANIVPWQLIAERTGAVVKPIPITDSGEIEFDALRRLIGPRTKVVGVVHISNSLGTDNLARTDWIDWVHNAGGIVLIDGAQGPAHRPVDVQRLGVDFYALSAHKMYGPMGMGALYGKKDLLEAMPPYQGGGDMIRTVSFEKTTFNDLPNKFEPGTPHVAGVIGWAAAVDYLTSIPLGELLDHEDRLMRLAMDALSKIPGVHLYGSAENKAGVVSFTVEGAHAHDVGTILDTCGVAVRSGHHCCMPAMTRYGIPATARASFGIYNDEQDLEQLVRGVHRVKEVFA